MVAGRPGRRPGSLEDPGLTPCRSPLSAVRTDGANDLDLLDETVIAGGYCIGCGLCAAPDTPYEIRWTELGQLQAARVAGAEPHADGRWLSAVCPFGAAGPREDEIASSLFGADCRFDRLVGAHLGIFAGHVTDAGLRSTANAGGLATWLLLRLLDEGIVDGVVHVRPTGDAGGPPVAYAISTTPDQVRAGARAQPYPVELSAVLRDVRARPGRYAVVGVPCYVTGLRRLLAADPVLAERLVVLVALFCGHQKSAAFTELVAREGEAADHPDLFRYKACDFCDDVVGETADVSIGEAGEGRSVVVARDPELLRLLRAGLAAKELRLDRLAPRDVVATQSATYRDRRDGLAYRLHLADLAGSWRPPRRVRARADHLSRREREQVRSRSTLAARSHQAFADAKRRGDVALFRRELAGPLRRSARLTSGGVLRRSAGVVARGATVVRARTPPPASRATR